MDKGVEKEIGMIAATIPEIREEIELAADEDAMPEDVEKVERRVAGVLERYNTLLRKLSGDEKIAVQRELGLKIEVLKAHFLKLREDS